MSPLCSRSSVTQMAAVRGPAGVRSSLCRTGQRWPGRCLPPHSGGHVRVPRSLHGHRHRRVEAQVTDDPVQAIRAPGPRELRPHQRRREPLAAGHVVDILPPHGSRHALARVHPLSHVTSLDLPHHRAAWRAAASAYSYSRATSRNASMLSGEMPGLLMSATISDAPLATSAAYCRRMTRGRPTASQGSQT